VVAGGEGPAAPGAGELLGLGGQAQESILEGPADQLHAGAVRIRLDQKRRAIDENGAREGPRDLEGVPGAEGFFLDAAKATGTMGARPSLAASMTPIWTRCLGPRGPSIANAASREAWRWRIISLSPATAPPPDEPRTIRWPNLRSVRATNSPSRWRLLRTARLRPCGRPR